MSTPRTAVLALGLLLLPAVATAQINADDIVDTILGVGSEPLAEVDITGDGVIDARDLACFVGGCNPPTIEFTLATTDAAEGDGAVQIALAANRSAFCTVDYTVEGTATAGVDYTALSGSVAIAGTSANLAVTILDDDALDEELELVILTLEPGGSCYQPGARAQHSLHLVDNDRTWFGTLEAHVPGSSPAVPSGDLLGVRLEVVRSTGGSSATLVSDGTGTLPVGSWDATSFSHGETAFAMAIEPVTVGGATTGFATALERTFTFAAADGTPGQTVEEALVRGTYTETIVPTDPASAHLATTVTGIFSLLQGLPMPSSWEPPLDPSP